MARIVRGILLCLLAVIVMSHNTSALELNIEVQTLWGNYVPNPVEYVLAQPNNYGSGLFVCYNSAGGNWNRVRGVNFSLPSGYTPRSGDIIEFSFNATSGNNQNVNIAFGAQATANGWDVVSWDFENATNSSGALKVILVAGSSATRNISLMRPEGWTIFDLNENECVGISNIGIYRPVGDSASAIINAINNNNSSQAIEDAKDAIVDAIQDAQDKEEQTAQDAVDDAQDSADSSQASVDATGQSLISAMTQIGTALMNTQASDCTINTATNHFTMGTLDLCSNVPQGIRTFVSGLLAIVLTPIILYYCFHIVNYIYNLFQEFQR